jgi:hypothetical protein
MRLVIMSTCAVALVAALGGCATAGGYSSACARDYARNRQMATAAGAVIGGAAGAALAKDDTLGAAIGAVVGGLVGHRLSRKDDPCGYGFGGYPIDPAYGYWDERAGVWRQYDQNAPRR